MLYIKFFIFYGYLVLKSDRANGEFAFTSTSLAPRTSAEGDILSFDIERRGGTFGSVLVTWEVQSLFPNNDTTNDFNPSTNEVLFEPVITRQVKLLLNVLAKFYYIAYDVHCIEFHSYGGQ